MIFKKITISNFKSLADQTVELNDFNLLVGANGSGKSNFVQALKFLRDIVSFGLEDAISLQGGVEYLRNVNIADSQPLTFHVVVEANDANQMSWFQPFDFDKPRDVSVVEIHRLDYAFALQFQQEGSHFTIEKDRMIFAFSPSGHIHDADSRDISAESTVELIRTGGRVEIRMSPKSVPLTPMNTFPIHENKLLVEHPIVAQFYAGGITDWIGKIGVYDLYPKEIKAPTSIASRAELEIDGNNLAALLGKLLRDHEKKRSFLNICRDLLPFVRGLGTEKVADSSIFLTLREEALKEEELPAFLISDGTANIMALVFVLYFQKNKHLSIFEEPDRNLHPYLLSRVMTMFREASDSKQIIATTHSPGMVKHAGLENILLVSRDKSGFSRITRPADSEHVRIFLDNELGIDDLFIDNLLGV